MSIPSRPSPRLAAIAVLLLCAATAACAGRRAGGSELPRFDEVREFVIPWPDAFPNDVAIDSLGRLWFTDRLTHGVGRLDPETGAFHRFDTPVRPSAPYGMAAAEDGGIWMALSGARALGRLDPATGAITVHPLPGVVRGPNLIAVHGDRVWFTVRDDGAWGSYDMRTGETRLVHTERERPYGIAIGADGTVWVGSFTGLRLYRVDPATGDGAALELAPGSDPAASAGAPGSARTRSSFGPPRRLAADRAGGVWYTDMNRAQLVRFLPAHRSSRTWSSLVRSARPYGIAVSSTGLVWYVEGGTDQVVVLHPVLDQRRTAALPVRGAAVRHIVIDERRSRVWLPLSDAGRIGLVEYR